MKKLKRGIAAVLAMLMLIAVFPTTALADELAPSEAPPADEVIYNTGRVEVTVGCDQEKAEDEDLEIWYDLFNENGGYTINLDLFEADPLFPYEVQFKYQDQVETKWFETIEDTVEVGGHTFSLYTDSQPQSIGLWVGDEYFQARPVEKEFTNEGGFGLFSMMPLTETRLAQVDLSGKIGTELKNVKVEGGPVSGVWAIAENDNYLPFNADTTIDLSPYMGQSYVDLELINGNDPLDSSFTRYIVRINLCNVANLLEFQAYVGARTAAFYANRRAYYYVIQSVTWPKWSMEPATLKVKLGTGFSGYDVDIYLGNFATEEEAKAADPSANITDLIWDDGSHSDGPGYEAPYGRLVDYTAVFKKSGAVVYVYNFRLNMSASNANRIYDLMLNFDADLIVDGETVLDDPVLSTYGNGIGAVVYYANDVNQANLRMYFSSRAGTNLPNITVYKGIYQSKEKLEEAIANGSTEDITDAVWGADKEGYRADYTKNAEFTFLLKQGEVPDADWGDEFVLPFRVFVSVPSVFIYPESSIYADITNYEGELEREMVGYSSFDDQIDDYSNRTYSYTYMVYNGYKDAGPYYVSLYGSAMGESISSGNLDQYIQKAVVGRCETAAEVNAADKADIKAQLFSYAGSSGGYHGYFRDKVTFTVLDTYDKLHYVTVWAVVEPELAERPTPLSDDTYFRVQGAKKAEEDGSKSNYKSYFMKYTDDSYYYNGYQTVFLLNQDDTPVTDATIYPTFWTGSTVNVYASLDTASGRKVESGTSPAENIEFGKPIHYSAGSESGTHLKNYWVTFVTKKEGGPALFVNGATNSEHLDKDDNNLPVREVFLNANYGYHHDIFFANIGDAVMEDLEVELDAENVALDDYWRIKETKTLASFTTVNDWTTSYGELSNVSKIRLVPKVNADGTIATGEISGKLTFRYKGGDPVVIKLTGTAAKPRITTESVLDGVKFVHYSSVIQTDNMYNADGVTFKISSGSLPSGITLKPNGELYGVPTVYNDTQGYTFTVQALYNGAVSDTKTFTMKIANNTNVNVWDATDTTYEITTAIPNEDGTPPATGIDENSGNAYSVAEIGDNKFSNPTQLFESQGEYSYFVEVRLDGKLLVEGKDYTKERGSTRLTLQTNTLKGAGNGTHTLSTEFREGDTMKKASQNYTNKSSSGGGGGGGFYVPPAKPTDPTEPEPIKLPFEDVPKDSWFYEDVYWVYDKGYMIGISDTLFAPKSAVTQADVLTVLARMAKVDLSKYSNANAYPNITAGQWYTAPAVWATREKLLPDGVEFSVLAPLSRGDMAIMLVKYLNYIKVNTKMPNKLAEFADADLMTQAQNDAFQVLYSKGIFKGVGDLRMDPVGSTSRCEFAALVNRLNGLASK